MHLYKPSKLAMFTIYLFVIILSATLAFALLLGAIFLADFIWYILIIQIIFTLLVCFIVVPVFFSSAYYSMGYSQIVMRTGVFIFSKQYMRTDSIKSFTKIVTPFSRVTGLNFVVINALGSKMVVLFLSRKDCDDICEMLNGVIKNHV